MPLVRRSTEASSYYQGSCYEKGLIEGRAPHYTISLKVAKMTKQIGHYTKENGLAENSIQKLLLQLAHNAGSMGFKRQDVYEGLHQVIIWAYSVVLSRFKSF